MLFLSTLSLRRATFPFLMLLRAILHFYPRSPCGERRSGAAGQATSYGFLSTLSLRRATRCLAGHGSGNQNFYPRSPCGERLHAHRVNADRLEFLSTLSLRRATLCTHAAARGRTISIHALLAESDPGQPGHHRHHSHFYPRSPCGERRSCGMRLSSTIDFYPRSPCGERQL